MCLYVRVIESDRPTKVYDKNDEDFCDIKFPITDEGSQTVECNSEQPGVPLERADRITKLIEIRLGCFENHCLCN